MTRRTLKEVRTALTRIFDAGANEYDKNLLINEVQERILLSGKYRGSICEVDLAVYDSHGTHGTPDHYSYITLPRQMMSAMGAVKSDETNWHGPMGIRNHWHEFNLRGVGRTDKVTGGLIDMGEGFVTFRDMPEPGTITVASDAEDDGDTLFISGEDADGLIVSENVTLNSGGETTDNTYVKLRQIVRVAGNGYITLSAGGTTFASLEPGEESPNYRRYKVNYRRSDDTDYAITVRGQRQPVKLISDNDIVYPANIGALKNALFAVMSEDEADPEAAVAYWNACYKILNDEIMQYHPNNIPVRFVQPHDRRVQPVY